MHHGTSLQDSQKILLMTILAWVIECLQCGKVKDTIITQLATLQTGRLTSSKTLTMRTLKVYGRTFITVTALNSRELSVSSSMAQLPNPKEFNLMSLILLLQHYSSFLLARILTDIQASMDSSKMSK
jgi:hypothetical protein